MVIQILDQIVEDEITPLYEIYSAALERVRTESVQRKVMYPDEFAQVMTDRRIWKLLSCDDAGTVRGIAAFSTDLKSLPMIAPEYFEKNWPKHYAARKIWYIMFVAVHPQAQAGTFGQLAEQVYREAIVNDGLVGLDLCNYDEDVRHLPRDLRMLVETLTTDVKDSRIDQQATWLYEFPSLRRQGRHSMGVL